MGHAGSEGRCVLLSLEPSEGIDRLFKPHLILSKCMFIPEPVSQVIWTANPSSHPTMKESRESISLTLTKWALLAEPLDSCSVGSLLCSTCSIHQKRLGHHIYKTDHDNIPFATQDCGERQRAETTEALQTIQRPKSSRCQQHTWPHW